MDLYLERGFEQTTVAEIAQRAGLTARTFFRYFADKREVLFGGSAVLQDQLVARSTPRRPRRPRWRRSRSRWMPRRDMLGADREYSRRRQAVIDAQRRTARARADQDGRARRRPRRRAAPARRRAADASLAAEAGVAVFRVAFERWVTQAEDRPLADVMRESLAELKALSAAS